MSYNGYSNFQTWCVMLWLDNDQATQEFVTELINESTDQANLADKLAVFVYEYDPLLDQASMYADLLHSAIRQVDFYELAGFLLEY